MWRSNCSPTADNRKSGFRRTLGHSAEFAIVALVTFLLSAKGVSRWNSGWVYVTAATTELAILLLMLMRHVRLACGICLLFGTAVVLFGTKLVGQTCSCFGDIVHGDAHNRIVLACLLGVLGGIALFCANDTKKAEV